MAKILNMRSNECTLFKVDGEAVEAAEVEDMAEMLLVRVQGVGKNQYIIQIDETKWEIAKDFVHHPLENLGLMPKGRRRNSKRSKGVMKVVL